MALLHWMEKLNTARGCCKFAESSSACRLCFLMGCDHKGRFPSPVMMLCLMPLRLGTSPSRKCSLVFSYISFLIVKPHEEMCWIAQSSWEKSSRTVNLSLQCKLQLLPWCFCSPFAACAFCLVELPNSVSLKDKSKSQFPAQDFAQHSTRTSLCTRPVPLPPGCVGAVWNNRAPFLHFAGERRSVSWWAPLREGSTNMLQTSLN